MIWILVGTETGNSLDFAERAGDELYRFGVENEIFLMDDLPMETFLEECQTVLFICSTTGDGDAPLCMRSFTKFLLRADLPGDLLEGMKFAVFGLGDSSYEKFNFVGKRLWRRLPQLGAEPLVPFRGEGDEQNPKGGLEHGWQLWWSEVKRKLCANRREMLTETVAKHTLNLNASIASQRLLNSCHPFSLVCNVRMTPTSHFQDTRLLKFSIEIDEMNVQPGDIIALLPDNNPAVVDELLELLSLDKERIIFCIDSSCRVPWTNESIPFPLNFRDFFLRFVDISAIPSRNTCSRLAQLVDITAAPYSEMHKEKLMELAVDESEYLDYIWRPKRTIVELLRDFMPSVRIPVESLLHVFKPLRRRQFSIASVPKMTSPGRFELELCVGLVEHELLGGRGKREGVISRCFRLNRLLNGSAQFLKGSWNMSILSQVESVLLFATGTGIAPIRHLIQFIRTKSLDVEITLFFGCRSLEADFYFAQEWRELGIRVFAAGSRDSPGRKVYLDSIIEREAEFLQSLDVNKCACFVAGHTRLSKLVSGSLSSLWGQEAVQRLKLSGLFQTETWS